MKKLPFFVMLIAGIFCNYLPAYAVSNYVDNINYAESLGWPGQNAVYYDGEHYGVFYSPGTGSSVTSHVAYAYDSDMTFGTPHDIPTYYNSGVLESIVKGSDLATWFMLGKGYNMYLAVSAVAGGTAHITNSYKENGTLESSNHQQFGSSIYEVVALANTGKYPSVISEGYSYTWMASNVSNNIKVLEFPTSAQLVSPSVSTTATITGTDGFGQVISYYNVTHQVGLLWSDDSTLYYRHYDPDTETWGSDDTVDSNLESFKSFAGVATTNDSLFVVYRDATDHNLYYRIYDSVAGTWGTDTEIGTDITTREVDAGFGLTADLGKDEMVYIVYSVAGSSNADINYVIWNGSTISSATTLVDEVTLMSTEYISTNLYDVERVGVMYHQLDGDIKFTKIEMTAPDVKASEGMQVVQYGHPTTAINPSTQPMRYYNGKVFITYIGRNGGTYANVWDVATEMWDFETWELIAGPIWDVAHNATAVEVADDGYIYIIFGGRDGFNSSVPYEVWKSDYPLDNASFTCDISVDWTDISPPGSLTGRGYKQLIVDGTTLHLFYQDGDDINLIEYRAGTWGSADVIVSYSDFSGNIWLYTFGAALGLESTGQKSIGFFWVPLDYSQTSLGQWLYASYAKIVPQGDGTYKQYKADGTEVATFFNGLNTRDVAFGIGGENLVESTGNYLHEGAGESTVSSTVTNFTDDFYNVITATSMNMDIKNYRYHDYGTDYFSGDFTHHLKYYIDASQGTNARHSFYILTDVPGTLWSAGYTLDLVAPSIITRYDSTTNQIALYLWSTSGNLSGVTTSLSRATQYYVTIEKDTTAETLTMTFRTGGYEGVGSVADTIELDLSNGAAGDTYRYAELAASIGDGSGSQLTNFVVSDFHIRGDAFPYRDWGTLQNPAQGFGWIALDQPYQVMTIYDKENRTGQNKLIAVYWTGTKWEFEIISEDAYFSAFTNIVNVPNGITFLTASKKDESDVYQIVNYTTQSLPSFANEEAVTSSTSSEAYGTLSQKNIAEAYMYWMVFASQAHAEINLLNLIVGSIPPYRRAVIRR